MVVGTAVAGWTSVAAGSAVPPASNPAVRPSGGLPSREQVCSLWRAAHLEAETASDAQHVPDLVVLAEGPQLSRAAIDLVAGDGLAVTPDLCIVNVDVRTTPTFDSIAAAQHLEHSVDAPDLRGA